MKKIFIALPLAFMFASSGNANDLNIKSFEIVWQTINEKYYDSTFGGLNWNEVHDQYLRQIIKAKSDTEFYLLINKMLFELNVSHIGVVPPDDLHQIEPIMAAEGSIGIDVRILEDNAVITSVKSDSPGARAGLRAGYIIKSIDGIKIEQLTDIKHINDIKYQDIDEETLKNLTILTPPYNEPHRINKITSGIRERIYGLPDTTVSIAYMDKNGDTHQKKIIRAKRIGKMVFDDKMPPSFVEFEAKRLGDNIGYIWFNAFIPPVDQKFIKAIDSMEDTSGLIIDIRGNPGGFFPVRKALAEKIIKGRTLFWSYKKRNGTQDVYLDPAKNAYGGPVVILIDALSGSSSEEFAGGMKAINRAVIVGERSPGKVLIMETLKLENGGVLLYPFGQTRTADGTILEGNGVVPDIEVILDRNALLNGKDSQIEAAINFLSNNIQK